MKLRIGSRDSRLAVAQSNLIIDYLKRECPDIDTELVTMKTSGDMILDKSLYDIGGKGLFVKELDKALIEHRTDISVHSLKDMPMIIPEELPIICYSKREDPRDVLVLPEGITEIDTRKPIGTSSLRRELQLEKLYPECTFKSIRGNIQTRLAKLDRGEYSAIILAAAGLKRLGLENRISRFFAVDEVLPAAGQGILAVQSRTDIEAGLFNNFSSDFDTSIALCERAFVSRINGGCSTPAAAFAENQAGALVLKGLYVPEGTRKMIFGELSGDIKDAISIGMQLADNLLEKAKV